MWNVVKIDFGLGFIKSTVYKVYSVCVMATINASKCFNVYKTTLEMLEDRKYKVDEKHKKMEFEIFKELYEMDSIDINLDNKVYISFYNKTLGTSQLDKLVTGLLEKTENDDLHVIVVLLTESKPSHTVEKLLHTKDYRNVELFHYNKLIFNITRHDVIGADIKVLEDDELSNVLTGYDNLSAEQRADLEAKELGERNDRLKRHFPHIPVNDAVCRYFNAQKGQVLEVKGRSLASAVVTTYRLVV